MRNSFDYNGFGGLWGFNRVKFVIVKYPVIIKLIANRSI
jgi:hypothetical protein